MNTQVIVEFFKPHTGKWYTSFEFETNTHHTEMTKLVSEAQKHKEFIPNMNYVVTSISPDREAVNKYLLLYEANQSNKRM